MTAEKVGVTDRDARWDRRESGRYRSRRSLGPPRKRALQIATLAGIAMTNLSSSSKPRAISKEP
jgi:hypothetical protein